MKIDTTGMPSQVMINGSVSKSRDLGKILQEKAGGKTNNKSGN